MRRREAIDVAIVATACVATLIAIAALGVIHERGSAGARPPGRTIPAPRPPSG